MFVLSILGILLAGILMAYYRERLEREREEQRRSRIRWYADNSHRSERVK